MGYELWVYGITTQEKKGYFTLIWSYSLLLCLSLIVKILELRLIGSESLPKTLILQLIFMNKFCFSLMLFLSGMFALMAQGPVTLKWKLVDENYQAISNAVVIKNDASLFVLSDEQGRFTIEVTPGKDTLLIQYIGREGLIVPISSATPKEWTEVMIEAETFLCFGGFFRKEQANEILQNETRNDLLPAENQIISQARVSPNPTPDLVFLQQNSALGMVELYNLSRQKLQSFNFGEQLNASIDLSTYPAGTYFLRSNQGWVEKVVLQK